MEMSPDHRLFEWINGLSGNEAVDAVMKFIVNDYFVPVMLALMMLGLWFGGRSVAQRQRNQWGVVWAAVGVGFTNLLIQVLNLLVELNPWPRPYIVDPDLKPVFGYLPTDPSFPANSAAVAFAFATGVFMRNRRWGAAMYVIALLWGFSRVYVGIHYPLDILGGAVIAIVITLIFRWALLLFEPAVTVLLGVAKTLHLSDIPEVFSWSTINWRPTIATKWWKKKEQ